MSHDGEGPPPPHDRDCDDPAACIADLFADDGRDDAAMRYTRRQALRYVRSVEERLAWAIKATQGCHAIDLSEEEIQWIRYAAKRSRECREARQKLMMQAAGWAVVSAVGVVVLALALGIGPALTRMLAP